MEKGNLDEINKTLNTVDVPAIYANGFTIATTVSDVSIVLMRNNRPFNLLNLSFTTAKTLAQGLTQAIAEFEKLTTTEITTITQFQEKVKQNKKS